MEFFDFDPVRGVRYDWDYNEMNGDITIHTSQDVSGALKYAHEVRTHRASDKNWKQDDFALYAVIPAVVEMELLKKGIDINRPEDHARMVEEIEKNYPLLKCTDKHG